MGNGTATGILIQGGRGREFSIRQTIIDVGGSDYAVSLFGLARVHITGTGYDANKYAVSMRDIGEAFIISNCYNIHSTGPLALRYSQTDPSGVSRVATSGDVPEIDWVFNNNEGINSGFVYSQAQLKSITSKVNTVNKAMGKIILACGENKEPRYYYATGHEINAAGYRSTVLKRVRQHKS